MNNTYLFDVDVAVEYGLYESIVIKLFQFWITKNKANNTNFYDNHYWTYNSKKALLEMFPFWTEQNLRTIMDHLLDKGILITGNYNTNKYDHTLWYAFVDEEKWLGSNQQIDMLKLTNRCVKTNKPIPDIYNTPDNNIIINNNILSAPKGFVKPSVEEVKTYCEAKGYTFDPESFVAYYDSNGWMVGKSKMKNWKAACTTWAKNGFSKKEEKQKEFYW